MKIGLIRHGRVIHKERWFSTGKKFNEGREFYNTLPIEVVELRVLATEFPVCYASSMMRAIETAKAIYPGHFIVTDALVEVRNAAFLFSHLPFPTSVRKALGRLAWFFNVKKMPETRAQSILRARSFLESLLNTTHENTLLVTHGFFMRCLIKELRSLGFIGPNPLTPKNATLYVFEKPD